MSMEAASGIERLTLEAHGVVQGVGYRAFCSGAAAEVSRGQLTKLTGYSANLPNGSTVEVVAEGPRELLERFLAELRRGPPAARVLKVDVIWGAATREFDGFRLR